MPYSRGRASPHTRFHDEVDEKREAFRKQLSPFPHLFQLRKYWTLSACKLQDIRDRVEREGDEHERSTTERHRDLNLTAFISFHLEGQKGFEKAKKGADDILRENKRNIVALANLAVFTWETASEVEAQVYVDRLQRLQQHHSFKQWKDEATAELAYCYSRMGPCYLELARNTFEIVHKEMPQNYDAMLGFAMVLRRSTHKNSRMCHQIDNEECKQRLDKANELLNKIINTDSVSNTLKAQAYAESGLVLYCDRKFKEAEKAFENALQVAPDDPVVLLHVGKFWQSGNRYKNIQLLNRSRYVLEKSVNYRGTTTAHHTLGLTFKKLAIATLKKDVNQKRRHDGSLVCDLPLTRNDENVKKAEEHLRRALDISHGQNTSARFNLAELLKDMGEEDNAISQLQSLLAQKTSLHSPRDFIRARELAGTLMLSKSRSETSQQRKKELRETGTELLLSALNNMTSATEIYSITDIRMSQAYRTLLAALKDYCVSGRIDHEKAASIYFCGQNYREALKCLNMSEQCAAKGKFEEIELDCLVKLKMFENAMSFLSLMLVDATDTDISKWRNKELPVQACILAMQHQLGLGCTSAAGTHCQQAFRLKMLLDECERTGNCEHDTDREKVRNAMDSSDVPVDEPQHVTIIHDMSEPSLETKVYRLKSVLQDICGLRVFCRSDVHPGAIEWRAVLESVWRSDVLAIVTGNNDLSFPFLQGILLPSLPARSERDSRCRDVVVIQTGDSRNQLPKELRSLRIWQWPDALPDTVENNALPGPNFGPGSAPFSTGSGRRFSETEIDCICNLLYFILNTEPI